MSYKHIGLTYDKEVYVNYNLEVVFEAKENGKFAPSQIVLSHNSGSAINDELSIKAVAAISGKHDLSDGKVTVFYEQENGKFCERQISVSTNEKGTRLLNVGKKQEVEPQIVSEKVNEAKKNEEIAFNKSTDLSKTSFPDNNPTIKH